MDDHGISKFEHQKQFKVSFDQSLDVSGADSSFQSSSSVGASVITDTTLGTSAPSSVIHDREFLKDHMIETLTSHDSNEQCVTPICLIGPSGVGKTTMLYDVYNDTRISEYFDPTLWVCMSDNFSKERLMKEIIESITHMSCGLTQLSLLQEVIQEELAGKNFFLVLDDAEIEDTNFWSDLLTLLSVGAKGSSIVIITNKVDESTGAKYLYCLDPVSEEACWSIFHEGAFHGLDPISDPGLMMMCRKLVTRCNGNLFCVKALSGLIHYAIKENQVGDVLESEEWSELGGGKVSPVLTVCYCFLPVHLKQCFEYLSLFPKNHIFVKLDLVHLWMSQGLVRSIEGMEPEDVGIRYLDEMFKRSFLQHPIFVNAHEDKCVMHELIYELAKCIQSESFLRFEGRFHGLPQNVRHLSLVPSDFQTLQLKDSTRNARDLQSFLVISRSSAQKNTSIPRLLNFVNLNHLFLNSKYIRTLVLSNTDIEELPSSIGLLDQLHYLVLNNTKIKSIPLVLCSIKTLHTLEVKYCNQLAELPQNMEELVNLRHLDTRKLLGPDIIMPNGMGQLINLRILTTFNVGVDSLHCTISELKNLQNLRHLHINGINNAKNVTDAKNADLKSKIYLETLELQWCENASEEDLKIPEEVLQNIEPNRNLQELILRNYTGMQFPAWIADPSFYKLISITLDNCYNCDKFPFLAEHPSLRCLSVRRMHGVQHMWDPDSVRIFGKESVRKFPSLEVLNLCEMYALEGLFELKNGDFPRLRTLSISNCPMLKIIPQFPFLVEMSLRCCVQIPHVPELPSLEYMKIEEFHNMKTLNLPQMLPVLKRLEIRRCSKLSSVEGLSHLTSLEKLKLFKCPDIDSINNWQASRKENITCMSEEMGSDIETETNLPAESSNFQEGITTYLSEAFRDQPANQKALNTIHVRNAHIEDHAMGATKDQLSLKVTDWVPLEVQAATRIQQAFRDFLFKVKIEKLRRFKRDYSSYLLSHEDMSETGSRVSDNAVVSIQKNFRCWKKWKEYVNLRRSAVKIQSHYRAHQARKYKNLLLTVNILEKLILRWYKRGVGLRGCQPDSLRIVKENDTYIIKALIKQKGGKELNKAVSRVLNVVDAPEARQQYTGMRGYKLAQAVASSSAMSSLTSHTEDRTTTFITDMHDHKGMTIYLSEDTPTSHQLVSDQPTNQKALHTIHGTNPHKENATEYQLSLEDCLEGAKIVVHAIERIQQAFRTFRAKTEKMRLYETCSEEKAAVLIQKNFRCWRKRTTEGMCSDSEYETTHHPRKRKKETNPPVDNDLSLSGSFLLPPASPHA